jgi:hypothetical protein
MASRAVRHRLPTRERNTPGPVVYRPSTQHQRVSCTPSGLLADSSLRDRNGSDEPVRPSTTAANGQPHILHELSCLLKWHLTILCD